MLFAFVIRTTMRRSAPSIRPTCICGYFIFSCVTTRKLVEERRDGIGMGRGVMFDGLGDECQHGRAAYDATDPRSSVTRPR